MEINKRNYFRDNRLQIGKVRL